MALALYLERVVPSRYGVPSHHLFFLEGVPGLSWAAQPGVWSRLARRLGVSSGGGAGWASSSSKYASLSEEVEEEEEEARAAASEGDTIAVRESNKSDVEADGGGGEGGATKGEDEDVAAEATAAATADTKYMPLVLRSLRKVYPGKATPALAGVSLAACRVHTFHGWHFSNTFDEIQCGTCNQSDTPRE